MKEKTYVLDGTSSLHDLTIQIDEQSKNLFQVSQIIIDDNFENKSNSSGQIEVKSSDGSYKEVRNIISS